MALSPGATVGAYDVTARLGEGEVYRANEAAVDHEFVRTAHVAKTAIAPLEGSAEPRA